MLRTAEKMPDFARKLNILVLFDPKSLQTLFIQQHLGCFGTFSKHNIHYAAATLNNEIRFPLEQYDAVIIHFAVRLCVEGYLSSQCLAAVRAFRGPKVLLIQDEYDKPFVAARMMAEMGIDVVFTTVPAAFRETFYPAELVPGIAFRQCLTGYVPYDRPAVAALPPIAERPVWIGYRGRRLPIWYGRLAAEKHAIGPGVAEACRRRAIPHDIRHDEESRVNGPAWFAFMMRCRAVLGTESGANVVDVDGSIRAAVEAEEARDPQGDEEEIYRRHVERHDGLVRMNQISPKIFEAISLKTALVLFEGTYSGVLSEEHYVALKKDFSNVDEVLERLADVEAVQAMVDRAYEDIVETGRYSYETFVREVEGVIEQRAEPRTSPVRWTYAVVAAGDGHADWRSETFHLPLTEPLPQMPPVVEPVVAAPERTPLLKGPARQLWLALPEAVRRPVIRMVQSVIDR